MIDPPKIIVDTREKIPWEWEGDEKFSEVIHKKLDAGDYSIEGMEDILVIERKSGVDELYMNFTKERKRIFAEFERMKSYKVKAIIIECDCEDVFNPYRYYVNTKGINKRSNQMPCAVVAAGLSRAMLEYGIHVIYAGIKGRSMARGIMVRAYEMHVKGKL